MRETITTELLRRLQQAPPTAVLDIYDTKVRRLVLRVRPTGTHWYRLVLGRGRWYTLGDTDLIPSPALARAEAQKRLGDYASGADPRVAKRAARQLTFTDYLDQVYAPWLSAHQRTGDETIARLKTLFAPSLGPLNLSGTQCLAHREVAQRSAQERAHAGHREPGSGRAARAAQPRGGLGTSARSPADAGQGAG